MLPVLIAKCGTGRSRSQPVDIDDPMGEGKTCRASAADELWVVIVVVVWFWKWFGCKLLSKKSCPHPRNVFFAKSNDVQESTFKSKCWSYVSTCWRCDNPFVDNSLVLSPSGAGLYQEANVQLVQESRSKRGLGTNNFCDFLHFPIPHTSAREGGISFCHTHPKAVAICGSLRAILYWDHLTTCGLANSVWPMFNLHVWWGALDWKPIPFLWAPPKSDMFRGHWDRKVPATQPINPRLVLPWILVV